ncbi:MAG: glycoside hydrolase family 32 protein [Kiritimatiellae bacterium]|nr:glycoside hydrolase family 32 protein [Kiritimatiellia bacterium]
MKKSLLIAAVLLCGVLISAAAEDLLIADFEGKDYAGWQVEGQAFGDGPAVANVSPPNKVTGHLGKGLVNSYLGGDAAVGKLTSSPFKIERDHVNFLIGAGNHKDLTCINLLVDDKVERTAVGPAVKDNSGNEIMDWYSWNVKELKGKQARIQIIDAHTGGWGHINIDHIHQSDTAKKAAYPDFARLTDPNRTYKSLVPKFTFATSLAEQERELAKNPLLERFKESRQKLLEDPHYPRYHFCSPENRLNDPNGLCFWQGRWHLFYQAYPPEDSRQHWGHAISDDLIHWRDLPYAIYPNPEHACYSGSTLVEKDRVIAMYHGTRVGSMVAVSNDPLLLNWEKLTGQAVIPYAGPGDEPLPYNIFDPCIWKQGEYYYALTAGKKPAHESSQQVRAEFLHRSKDLIQWEYLHTFLEGDHYGLVGDDGACPYFWPIGDKHILLHFSHKSGGKYLLGNYDTERNKFMITDGGDFNHGPVSPGGVHAPSACPDGKGGVITIFNINPAKNTPGWNQLMSLPMRLTLGKVGTAEVLQIEPTGDIESLRNAHQSLKNLLLPANKEVVLSTINGNTMELNLELDSKSAQMLELKVLRSPDNEEFTRIVYQRERGYRGLSAITIDNTYSSTLPDVRSRVPETAQFMLAKDEPLKLRIFIDRSVVEVFVNGRQYAALRVYPGRADSQGVSLRAQGSDGLLKALDAWQMKSIYD